MTLQWLACNVGLIVATNVNDPNTAICCCFVSVSGLVRANRSMFPVDEVLRLRTNTESGRLKYVEFLQHYIPTIIGARKWSGVRQVMLVNECFTYSDEAFLLLCYECYHRKWLQEYTTGNGQPSASDDEQANNRTTATATNGAAAMEMVSAHAWLCRTSVQPYRLQLTNMCFRVLPLVLWFWCLQEQARYVGRMRGTRKGWSKAGQNRFNALMVQVFLDRKQNGVAFDDMMRCRMRETYGKKRASQERNDNDLTGAGPVVVYSDLNLEYMIRQANLHSAAAE